MTREELTKVLKDWKPELELMAKYNDNSIDYQRYSALDMAIEVLEQEPCDDAISRQAMHIELEKWITYGEYKYSNATKYLYDRIDRLPPVTPQPKTGHWLNVEGRTDWYDAAYKCSCCGREIITPYELIDNLYSDYPYCHCGAKMESEEV